MVHPATCECCSKPSAAAQSLEELDFQRSACHFAQSGNLHKLAAAVSAHPASVHSDGIYGHSGFTPMHYAARSGNLECVQLLLDKGCDVNSQTDAGRATALHRAAYMGHHEIVRFLLLRGAHPQIQDADGMTALHKAALRGHQDVCVLLLQHDDSLADIVTNRGLTYIQLQPPP